MRSSAQCMSPASSARNPTRTSDIHIIFTIMAAVQPTHASQPAYSVSAFVTLNLVPPHGAMYRMRIVEHEERSRFRPCIATNLVQTLRCRLSSEKTFEDHRLYLPSLTAQPLHPGYMTKTTKESQCTLPRAVHVLPVTVAPRRMNPTSTPTLDISIQYNALPPSE